MGIPFGTNTVGRSLVLPVLDALAALLVADIILMTACDGGSQGRQGEQAR